jgi:hypothetical protein
MLSSRVHLAGALRTRRLSAIQHALRPQLRQLNELRGDVDYARPDGATGTAVALAAARGAGGVSNVHLSHERKQVHALHI